RNYPEVSDQPKLRKLPFGRSGLETESDSRKGRSMYSIVMIAAMTAAPETPDFFFKNKGGCHGCYGGSSGCYGGCAGCYGGCAGCMGSSCHGGYGGGFCGFHKSSCHGCQGYASAYGTCHGYAPYAGCCGGSGIGTSGRSIYTMSGYGEGSVPYVSPAGSTPVVDVPVAVSSLPSDKAQVVVRVPADAKLYADGAATSLTATEPAFLTPTLTPHQ